MHRLFMFGYTSQNHGAQDFEVVHRDSKHAFETAFSQLILDKIDFVKIIVVFVSWKWTDLCLDSFLKKKLVFVVNAVRSGCKISNDYVQGSVASSRVDPETEINSPKWHPNIYTFIQNWFYIIRIDSEVYEWGTEHLIFRSTCRTDTQYETFNVFGRLCEFDKKPS